MFWQNNPLAQFDLDYHLSNCFTFAVGQNTRLALARTHTKVFCPPLSVLLDPTQLYQSPESLYERDISYISALWFWCSVPVRTLRMIFALTWLSKKDCSDDKFRRDGQTIFFGIFCRGMTIEVNDRHFFGRTHYHFGHPAKRRKMFFQNFLAHECLFGNLLTDDADSFLNFFFGKETSLVGAWCRFWIEKQNWLKPVPRK